MTRMGPKEASWEISHPYFLVPCSVLFILLQVPICPQKPQPCVYRYFIMQEVPRTGSNTYCSPCQAGTKVQIQLLKTELGQINIVQGLVSMGISFLLGTGFHVPNILGSYG